MTMKAIFAGDTVDRLLPLYHAECRRYNEEYNLAAGNTLAPTGDGYINEVNGPAQEVMFFIGFVADNGEDGLLKVEVA